MRVNATFSQADASTTTGHARAALKKEENLTSIMVFTVRCPRCKHDMLYQPMKSGVVAGSKKRCVYCGMTFSVHSNQVATRIVCEGKRQDPNTALF